MAWLMGDGFDFYNTVSDALLPGAVWNTQQHGVSPVSNSRYGVGKSLSPGNDELNSAFIHSNTFTNSQTVFVNFAVVNVSAGGFTSGFPIAGDHKISFWVSLYETLGAQCAIGFRNDGSMVFTSGDYWSAFPSDPTILATSSVIPTISLDVWNHFQVKFVVSASIGSIEVRMNGSSIPVLTASNVNSRGGGTGNDFCNAVRISQVTRGVGARWQANIEDFYVFNDQGVAPNDWQGDVRAIQQMPASDSTVTWTPNSGSTNFSRVNELTENADTSYVSTNTVNNTDQYAIQPLTLNDHIVAAQVKMFYRMDESGPHQVNFKVNSQGTLDSSTTNNVTTNYNWLQKVYTTDPKTSAAWTVPNLNAILIGPVDVE